MSQFILKKDMFKAYDRVNSPNVIGCNLNNLDNDFKYLFQTPFFLVHNIG